MRNQIRLFSSASLLLIGLFFQSPSAFADWSNKLRGFTFQPSNSTDYCTTNFFRSVDNLKTLGANIVSLAIPWSQKTITDSEIMPYDRTPTDQALRCGIEYVKSQDLEIGLLMYVETNGWRANIDPVDRDRWFRSMGLMAERYAKDFAQPYKARYFSLGTEMHHVASNEYNSYNAAAPGRYRWPQIAADVRKHFTGTLTYSVQHSGDKSIAFEDNDLIPSVDVIGFSGYWPLYANTKDGLLREWQRVEDEVINPARARYGKGVLLVEVGYRPCDFTFAESWNARRECTYSGEPQAIAWDALLSYFADKDYFVGMAGGWAWKVDPEDSGQGNTDYTPWGKPAAAVFPLFWPLVGETKTPTLIGVFPFGESQKPGTAYCDPNEVRIPSHGWSNLQNYQLNGRALSPAACILVGGPADNQKGDSRIGYLPTGTGALPQPANLVLSQNGNNFYCLSTMTPTNNGWSNFSQNGIRYDCIFVRGPADNPSGDPSRGYIPVA